MEKLAQSFRRGKNASASADRNLCGVRTKATAAWSPLCLCSTIGGRDGDDVRDRDGTWFKCNERRDGQYGMI